MKLQGTSLRPLKLCAAAAIDIVGGQDILPAEHRPGAEGDHRQSIQNPLAQLHYNPQLMQPVGHEIGVATGDQEQRGLVQDRMGAVQGVYLGLDRTHLSHPAAGIPLPGAQNGA